MCLASCVKNSCARLNSTCCAVGLDLLTQETDFLLWDKKKGYEESILTWRDSLVTLRTKLFRPTSWVIPTPRLFMSWQEFSLAQLLLSYLCLAMTMTIDTAIVLWTWLNIWPIYRLLFCWLTAPLRGPWVAFFHLRSLVLLRVYYSCFFVHLASRTPSLIVLYPQHLQLA